MDSDKTNGMWIIPLKKSGWFRINMKQHLKDALIFLPILMALLNLYEISKTFGYDTISYMNLFSIICNNIILYKNNI